MRTSPKYCAEQFEFRFPLQVGDRVEWTFAVGGGSDRVIRYRGRIISQSGSESTVQMDWSSSSKAVLGISNHRTSDLKEVRDGR